MELKVFNNELFGEIRFMQLEGKYMQWLMMLQKH